MKLRRLIPLSVRNWFRSLVGLPKKRRVPIYLTGRGIPQYKVRGVRFFHLERVK